ncbi:MAG: CDP-alcohol phosphatidyltransferase family protein, partial [Candidatus Binatia bacterium]
LLVITSYVMLGSIGGIPVWLAVVVVVRDVLIVTGYAIIYFLVEERLQVRPSLIGKWSTTLQLLTLGVALLTLHDPRVLSEWVLQIFIGASAIATIVSGFQYLYRGLVWLQSRASSITPPG